MKTQKERQSTPSLEFLVQPAQAWCCPIGALPTVKASFQASHGCEGPQGRLNSTFFFVLNMVGTPNDFYCETWEVSYFLDLHRFGWNPIVAEEHDLTKSAIGAFWIPVWFFWRGNGYWTNGFNKTTNYPLMDSQYPTKSLDHKLVLFGYCQPVLMGA